MSYMDPRYYMAARDGKVEVLLQNIDQLATQVTPNNNTVLHVAAEFGQLVCVIVILENCSKLVKEVNIRGDTPLHIAAREGCGEIVSALITFAKGVEDLESGVSWLKTILGAKNTDGDTPLHLAVRNGDHSVVKMVIDGDRQVLHPPNNAHETPLYLAAEKGLPECVSEILGSPEIIGFDHRMLLSTIGPDERTALHAAVISDSQENVELLWNWDRGLHKKDKYGWTPLHYAARLGHKKRVEQLLSYDRTLAYITAEEDNRKTPLHVAASQGHIDIIEEIKSHSPDCLYMLDSTRKNFLHIAIESENFDIINFYLYTSDPLIDRLVNHKDNDGNTPLHLLAASAQPYSTDLPSYLGLETPAFNNLGMTPLDILQENESSLGKDELWENYKRCGSGLRNSVSRDQKIKPKQTVQNKEEKEKKRADTNILVATLIATVTFAAGFTLPGGYDDNNGPNQGMAIMARNWAFQAFVITDTISLACSSSAVFLYVAMDGLSPLGGVIGEEFARSVSLSGLNKSANILLILAHGTMMLAFLTGVLVVLVDSSAIAISLCVIFSMYFFTYIGVTCETFFPWVLS